MSPKSLSPLLGYNNNVRHKGRIFHVQTEDSGVKYGHIITHLFVDGGRILKSVKTSYAEYVDNDRRAEIVRDMMRQQHKAMFIALRDGRFDAALEEPAAVAAGASVSPKMPTPVPPASRSSHPPGRYAASETRQVAAAHHPSSSPAPANVLPSARPAASAAPGPVSAIPREPMAARHAIQPARPPHVSSVPVRRSGPAPMAMTDRRHGASRPAAAVSQARPQRSRSVFGGDVVDEQTLDEVILTYLAAEAEAETTRKKK